MSLVSNIIPSIVQCFSLIIFGFFCGLIKLVDSRQASGIGLYVSKFALPCLLFNAMFSIKVADVNWSLIASIAIAKLVLYFSVFIFCSIIIRPRNLGTASIIGLFCTQTNDYSIFLPVLKSMFPELEIYVYLLSPVQMIIPCTFSYFFLEWEFSKNSETSQEFKNSTTTQKFCSVLIRIFSNPLFFMTSLGIMFNILFKSYMPEIFTSILQVVANSFPSTALFFLGFSMIGKMGKLKSSAILSLWCLVIVKFIVSPFIMRQFTNYVLSFCRSPDVKPMLANFTTFAFLYGTSPTSPAVFLIAYEYNAISDVISTGVVVSTCLFGPVVIIYATVVMFYDSKYIEKYQTEVRPTMNWVSVLSLICLIWTLIKVWKNDKSKYYYVRWALNFMCIFTIMMCIGNFLSQISLTKSTTIYLQTIAFFLIFVGMLGTRLWSVFLVILKYLQLQQQITRNMKIPISSINLILIITGVGSPILAGILAFAIKSKQASDITNPFYSYGLHQEVIVIIWLMFCLIGSLIFLLKLIKLRLKESYNLHLAYSQKDSNSSNSTKLTNPLIENENEQNIASINRYLCFFIYTIISLFLCCSLTSWRLINDARLGVYVILEFLDSIVIHGQGIFIFIVFGPQIGVFIIPLREKIVILYRSFKSKYIPKRRKFKVDQEAYKEETDLDLSRIHNEMSAVEFFNTFHRKHAVRNLSHDWTFRSNDDINLHGFTEANFIEWFVLFISVQDKIPKSYLNFCENQLPNDSHECLTIIGTQLFQKLLEENQLDRNNNFSEKIKIYTFKELQTIIE